MATNADSTADDDGKEVTTQDLHDLKYGKDGVEGESSDETDGAEESGEESAEASEGDETNSDDQATDESEESDEQGSDDDEAGFVKKFPHIKGDTLEEYLRNVEKSYENSTTEAMRLKGELDGKADKTEGKPADGVEVDPTDIVSLYAKQKMDEEITTAFTDFRKVYTQAVPGTADYDAFVTEVAVLSKTIRESQKRLASPKELYAKAAVILGWEASDKADDKDKLRIAVKGSASTSKTSSAVKAPKKSKVTDTMVAANRLMYPDKTDAEIREELEPWVK